eukprot:GHVU01055196.1.p1 GENE.GHVU01055196.1~~GHVU01055196.1.p1  ORF type:complete len:240 (+),score=18.71 GHVU01055196.1:108-722(+)
MDSTSVCSYFGSYAKLASQSNMLQDTVRTSYYHRAILQNAASLQDKTVMDVGAGSGVLSFFAVQAGAAKVYAVEASSMAKTTKKLVERNQAASLSTTKESNATNACPIVVVESTVEGVPPETIPDHSIDALVSEPIGTFLFNERMIESYLYARDRFLKPGGCSWLPSPTLPSSPTSKPKRASGRIQTSSGSTSEPRTRGPGPSI